MKSFLPDHLQEGMKRFTDQGIRPGGFLYAILTNDLRGAVVQADYINITVIPNIVMYCLENLPHDIWGDVESVEAWIRKF